MAAGFAPFECACTGGCPFQVGGPESSSPPADRNADDDRRPGSRNHRDHAVESQEEMCERLEPEHQRRQDELRSRIRELEAARERLRRDNETLQSTIREFNERIKEARRNNTFSLSKPGERLIGVIRTVQDLAQKMDETSRAVCDGEYSAFDAIKDQRDRDVILKLTGGPARSWKIPRRSGRGRPRRG